MARICLMILGCIAILLSSCAINQKHYRYIPPAIPADKKCITQCAVGKIHCQKLCQFKTNICLERKASGSNLFSSCYQSCKCVTSFNTCYTACGGQVIPD